MLPKLTTEKELLWHHIWNNKILMKRMELGKRSG
jgi:hypothetical protein